MAVTVLAAESFAGPDGGSAWTDAGETLPFAAASSAATLALQIIAYGDAFLAGDLPNNTMGGSLVPSAGISGQPNPIQRLNGAQIALIARHAAQSAESTYIQVVRSIDTLGAQIAAAGGALTSIPLTAPLSTPLAEDQTFVIDNGTTAQTWTVAGPTGAGMPIGSTYIGVDSQTPSATFAAGTALVYVAGNAGAFGWLASGGGTPALPAGQAVKLPVIAANVALVAGVYLPLFPGDFLQLVFAGTVSIGAGTVQVQVV
jgi:hypothetical protein